MNLRDKKDHITWRDVSKSYEFEYFSKALKHHENNTMQTAKSLGICRQTLYNALELDKFTLIDLQVEYNPSEKWEDVKSRFESRSMSLLVDMLK